MTTAVPAPIEYRAVGLSAFSPTSWITPAITVPACDGTPFRNARVWSRRVGGSTFTIASHAGFATACSQSICANRTATIVTNAALTMRMPNPAAYSTGRSSSIVVTPNLEKSRPVSSSDHSSAAPAVTAEKSPKNPASASASGKRSVAARENGRYREKNRTENSIAASDIHRSSGDARTARKPCRISSSTAGGGRWDRRPVVGRTRPAAPSSARPNMKAAASPAAHTRSRFSAPISAASGRVSTPPTTHPRIHPAPNSGNRRLACRVSTTTPYVPHVYSPCTICDTPTVSHRTG